MRENGYYWTRIDDEWSIEYWNDGEWCFDGYHTSDSDDVFDEVDEKRITRQQ